MKNQRGNTILIVVAVVGVIAIAIGLAFFSQNQMTAEPTPTPTATPSDTMMKDEATPTEAMMKDDENAGDDSMMNDDDSMTGETPTPTETAMMQSSKGTYEDYDESKLAKANDGDVVLFFKANWCPTCQALDADISMHEVPDGLTILKVDYDTETALKQKYGITYQHTLVQVDADGNMIQKWAGSPTLQSIVEKL
ncbi:thioredoxin family protein [candidate division WWE3 bacterium]|uniref:Thioredoxin family protein n=1 Tax=candidate division WWE3 bacterium TaxID=2053526 RepID=A0A955LL49_UNCKA|nr:thioredoxin family protein [candidate division WWE3 bacterium]